MMRLILHHWAFHAYVVWMLVIIVVILWCEGHVSTIVKKLWHKRRVSVTCPSRQRMTATTQASVGSGHQKTREKPASAARPVPRPGMFTALYGGGDEREVS
jgi:hypothetical protein